MRTNESEGHHYTDNPSLAALVGDPAFQEKVESICKRVAREFKPFPSYDWKDLTQDVILKLRRWQPRQPDDKPPNRLLETIARNLLIDRLRRPCEQAPSFESLLEDIESEERSWEIASEHDYEADIVDKIRFEELSNLLDTPKERNLFSAYFDDTKDVDEIAFELRISRQAVYKQWKKIFMKLRPYV